MHLNLISRKAAALHAAVLGKKGLQAQHSVISHASPERPGTHLAC